VIWLLEYMKIINVIYRGGAGGEFFGGLLQELEGVASKPIQHEGETERWFLKREDYQSHEPMVTRNDPREVQKPDWNKKLWNVRLDHGYGFSINQDFWTDYLWNDWIETRTIVFLSKTRESLDYTQQLAKCKLVRDEDREAGMNMIIDGILNHDQFWNRPWESQADLFALWMDTIPTEHSVLLVDPYDLLFNNRTHTEEEINRIADYLGLKCPNHWQNKIESYRIKNKNLINNTSI
jgi:hypothetical protein